MRTVETSIRRPSDLHRRPIDHNWRRQHGHLERHPPQDKFHGTVSYQTIFVDDKGFVVLLPKFIKNLIYLELSTLL